MNATNNDSAVPGNCDNGSTDGAQIDEHGCKRPVVLITGDSFDLPLELGSLLRDCGCSAFVTTDLEAMKDMHADPEVIVVNFANVQTADPELVQALREKNRKPVVCMLPYPTERQVARAAGLGADLLIFKPLSADEFKSRFRLLLWEQRNYLDL